MVKPIRAQRDRARVMLAPRQSDMRGYAAHAFDPQHGVRLVVRLEQRGVRLSVDQIGNWLNQLETGEAGTPTDDALLADRENLGGCAARIGRDRCDMRSGTSTAQLV
jgi:hypothetical protein